MSGKNPYLPPQKIEKASQDFDVNYVPVNKTVHVRPDQIPFGEKGEPGSLLDIALKNGIEIDHACGGVLACSTCHVIVKEGLESCNEATDEELDQLDNAPGTTFQSRLACQCVPNGTCKMVVEIPAWNRNMVKEGKH